MELLKNLELGEGLDLGKRKRTSDADLTNPYVAARKAWDERYGDLIARARHWRLAAFVAMAVAAVAVAGLIVISRQTRLVPFIVAVDTLGRPVGAGVAAPENFKIDEKVMKIAVADFVSGWRGITIDWELQRKQIDKVFGMIGQGSRAQVAISDWYRSDPPDKRGREGTVEVEIVSVLATAEKSWEVQWTETKRLATGQFQQKEHWIMVGLW